MFLDRKEATGKKNNDKIVVGYDLFDHFSQISFCGLNDENPETVSLVAGIEQYNIPTLLCKRKGVNQWFFGKEAIKNAGGEEAFMIDCLLSRALDGDLITIEDTEFDPVSLLALFIKRSLSLLSFVTKPEKIAGIMFTVSEMSSRAVEVFSKVSELIGLKTTRLYFQSRAESFFHYTMHQPQELWNYQVVVFDYSEEHLKTYRFECNKKTTPVVSFIYTKEYPEMKKHSVSEEEALSVETEKKLDMDFYKIVKETCEGRIISSAYLIGDGFAKDWCKESLKLLCLNRRVFQGNNLYSKGACYAMKERIEPSSIGSTYVYLGDEKLKSNIGIKVMRRGEESYLALLDAGENWYEVKKECDVILETGNSFSILITPLTGKEQKEADIVLEGLSVRPAKMTRIRITIYLIAVDLVHLKVEDLGFGDFYQTSHQIGEEELVIER